MTQKLTSTKIEMTFKRGSSSSSSSVAAAQRRRRQQRRQRNDLSLLLLVVVILQNSHVTASSSSNLRSRRSSSPGINNTNGTNADDDDALNITSTSAGDDTVNNTGTNTDDILNNTGTIIDDDTLNNSNGTNAFDDTNNNNGTMIPTNTNDNNNLNPQFPNWPLALFAITNSNTCADDLPVGTASEWNPETSSPYFCTDCTINVSNFWLQLVSVDDKLKFSIIWQFDTLKTLSERLRDAGTVGESVTWIVTTKEGEVTAMRGTWRWSHGNGGITAADATTTTPPAFGTRSNGGGGGDFCFGAGNYVDGVALPPLYGHCSHASRNGTQHTTSSSSTSASSSCGTLFENGAVTGHENIESKIYATPRSWVQVGNDLDGRAPGNEFGYSTALSPDGKCLVVGAPRNDDGGGSGSDLGENTGAVSVFKDIDGAWVPVGGDDGGVIYGGRAGDLAGYSVSASRDCERVAFGSPWSDGDGMESSGSAKVFEFVGGEWVRVGKVINGTKAMDYLGWSVSLSEDGERLAVGAHGNDDNGSNSGQVRVLAYDPLSDTWERLGNNILGEMPGDSSGWSVSLSGNGERVIIGAQYNDPEGLFSGHARVFEYASENWVQIGQDIDGENAYDHSGVSVSISFDGNRIAIRASGNDDNGPNSGYVRVYQYDVDSSAWKIMGTPIVGEGSKDESGFSVSLSSNGACVAIGARYNDDNGINSGHVRIHCYNGNLWSQIGGDIDGETADGWSGNSVSLSEDGNRVAIGARYNDGNGFKSGHVRVYDLII